MKRLIELAYDMTSNLFVEVDELNIIVKLIDKDEPEYNSAELNAVVNLIKRKLPFEENLNFIILDVLRIAGESYTLQSPAVYQEHKQKLYEYANLALPNNVKEFIIAARKLQHENIVILQNKRITELELAITELTNERNVLFDENITLITENQTLTTDNKYVLEDKNALSDKVTSLLAEHDLQNKKITQLEQMLADATQENLSIAYDKTQLISENQQLINVNKRLLEDNNTLSDQIEALLATIALLKSEKTATKLNRDALFYYHGKSIDTLKTKIAEVRDKLITIDPFHEDKATSSADKLSDNDSAYQRLKSPTSS